MALGEGAMPHRGRRSCQAGLGFLSVWEHVLTPRDRDLNPVLGPVVIAPSFPLYHRWQTTPSTTQHVAGSQHSPGEGFRLLDVAEVSVVGISTGEILEVVEDSTFYPRTHHCG